MFILLLFWIIFYTLDFFRNEIILNNKIFDVWLISLFWLIWAILEWKQMAPSSWPVQTFNVSHILFCRFCTQKHSVYSASIDLLLTRNISVLIERKNQVLDKYWRFTANIFFVKSIYLYWWHFIAHISSVIPILIKFVFFL